MPDSPNETPPATAAPAPRKARRRYTDYIILLVIIGAIVFAAFYQEQLQSFIALKMWDKGAPERQVTKFLTALQKGDEQTATGLFEPQTSYKPLKQGDKWNGFFIITQAGKLIFTLEETAPKGDITGLKTEFNLMGKGSALVTAPDGKGKAVDYRLEMVNGEWKITEMRGGTPEARPAAPATKQSPPPIPGMGKAKPDATPAKKQ